MASSSQLAVLAVLRSLYDNPRHSDLLVKCQNKTFALHKNIVSSHSTFFAKACEEGKWKEGETGIIILGDCVQDSIQAQADNNAHDNTEDVSDSQVQVKDSNVDNSINGAHKHKIPNPNLPYDPTRISVSSSDSDSDSSEEEPDDELDNEEADDELDDEPSNDEADGLFEDRTPHTPLSEIVPDADDAIDLPQTVGAMFEWMYSGTYSTGDNFQKGNVATEKLRFHAKLYALGEKYDVPALKNYAKSAFQARIEKDTRVEPLLEVAVTVFSTTPAKDTGLRSIVITTLGHQFQTQPPAPWMSDSVQAIPGLSSGLCAWFMGAASQMICATCHSSEKRKACCKTSADTPASSKKIRR